MPVAPSTLICLSLATLLVAAMPVLLYRRLRVPLALDWRATITGVAVFALFAMVLERGFNDYMLHMNPATAQWLTDPLAFVLYGTLAAGVFEEVGRFIAMHLLQKSRPQARTDGTGFGYGIGHGGAEAWLVGVLVQLQWIVFAVLANRGQLDEHLANLSMDAVLRVHLILANLSPLFAGVFVVERVAAFVFQIALSVLMWRGVRAGSKRILPIAIVLHALIDLPAMLYQAHIVSLVAVDAVYAVAALAVAALLVKVYRSGPRAVAAA